jgi:hypothetical protein
MGDGMGVPLVALNGEHFFVTRVGFIESAGQSQSVAEIAETVGEFARRARPAVILDRRFPGRPCLDEIPSMKKNAGTMFIVFSHVLEPSLVSRI